MPKLCNYLSWEMLTSFWWPTWRQKATLASRFDPISNISWDHVCYQKVMSYIHLRKGENTTNVINRDVPCRARSSRENLQKLPWFLYIFWRFLNLFIFMPFLKQIRVISVSFAHRVYFHPKQLRNFGIFYLSFIHDLYLVLWKWRLFNRIKNARDQQKI